MSQSVIKTGSKALSLADFVNAASLVPAKSKKARIIFAFDCTASRLPTRNMAAKIQADMLTASSEENLEIALGYFRGDRECRLSNNFYSDGPVLEKLMRAINCQMGETQIGKMLSGFLAKKDQDVRAAVFIGDAFEEHDLPSQITIADKLKSVGIPVFMFQEGHDEMAAWAFSEIAKASGGLHCQFDRNSAQQLKDLLKAISAYATGRGFDKLSSSDSKTKKFLSEIRALPAPT